MSIWVFLLIFIVIAGVSGVLLWRRKQNINDLLAAALSQQLAPLGYYGNTPGGAQYRARAPLAIETQNAIDQAFDTCDRIAAHYGYQNRTGRGNFLLNVLPAEHTSLSGYPSIAVPIRCDALGRDSYCGGEYDQGVFKTNGQTIDPSIHYILAAERVLEKTFDNRLIEFLVIEARIGQLLPDMPALEYLRKSIVYGWEHAALFHNDRVKYSQTIGAGRDVHPHLPMPTNE